MRNNVHPLYSQLQEEINKLNDSFDKKQLQENQDKLVADISEEVLIPIHQFKIYGDHQC
jgi:hypothetical protein